MSWFTLPRDIAALRLIADSNTITLHTIKKELKAMGAREDAADARTAELIELIRVGSAAKDAEIAQLREALANADANALAMVDEALAADSETDAAKKEAGNAALEELVAAPVEPTPDQPA